LKKENIQIGDEVIAYGYIRGIITDVVPRGCIMKSDTEEKYYPPTAIELNFRLEEGDRVQIVEHFLPVLNGRKGVVKRFNTEDDTFHVLLDDKKFSTPRRALGTGRRKNWLMQRFRLRKL
jgi:hypothetical protein